VSVFGVTTWGISGPFGAGPIVTVTVHVGRADTPLCRLTECAGLVLARVQRQPGAGGQGAAFPRARLVRAR
jgi:hypothetical protein